MPDDAVVFSAAAAGFQHRALYRAEENGAIDVYMLVRQAAGKMMRNNLKLNCAV